MIKTVLAAAVATLIVAGVPSSSFADGKQMILDNKCDKCHSVDALGIASQKEDPAKRAPDLSKVGTKHDSAAIQGWLKKEVEFEFDGQKKKHKKKWAGTDEDLKAIADYLATLKGE